MLSVRTNEEICLLMLSMPVKRFIHNKLKPVLHWRMKLAQCFECAQLSWRWSWLHWAWLFWIVRFALESAILWFESMVWIADVLMQSMSIKGKSLLHHKGCIGAEEWRIRRFDKHVWFEVSAQTKILFEFSERVMRIVSQVCIVN